MRLRALLILLGLTAYGASDARAQSIRTQCATAASAVQDCERVVDMALTLPSRVTLAAAGGNPVAGTASTLGMRVPGSPRWSLALRGTVARATLPPAFASGVEATAWSLNADASIGLFNGFHLLPTIGGFGSIDVLASVGLLSVPSDDGFDRSSPLTWALGARLGVLRESFTAPGISVSAMYRALPDIEYGEFPPGPSFLNAGQHALTLRGLVGKRILGVDLAAGIGWDRASSDVRVQYDEPGPVIPRTVTVQENDLTFTRTSFFGNLSYTLMILNLSAELGWQADGDAAAGAHPDTSSGGPFGGIAVRLAI